MGFTWKSPPSFAGIFFGTLILLAYFSFVAIPRTSLTLGVKKYTENDFANVFLENKSQLESFAQLMRSFPWHYYRNATSSNNIPEIQNLTEILLTTILVPYTIKESPIPINSECQAPRLLKPEQIGKCIRTEMPRKIGALINFGFDVDALELHLQELDEIVDKFFLVEGTKIHNRYLDSKPSIWDKVKYTQRFSRFRHKIVHFIIDDADYSSLLASRLWDREYLQGQLRLKKFLEWNSVTKYFSSDDLIGIGDTDEIPNRNVINFLKHCELQPNKSSVDIGIWYPFPYMDTIFASDWPVPGHPFTFGDPTYWTLTAVNHLYANRGNKEIPGRTSGQGEGSILGGIHFSQYPYLPFQLIKSLTGTERELEGISTVINIGTLYGSMNGDNDKDEKINVVATNMWVNIKTKAYRNRIKSVDWFRNRYGKYEANNIIKLPWFFVCNMERFSSFAGNYDIRLNTI